MLAEANGEKVIFLGHIPSGDAADTYLSDYATQYVKIVNKYKDIIVGQFFGHTHNDEVMVSWYFIDIQFEIVMDGNGNPISVIYIAPSVTTYTYHNPAFRVYEYTQDYELIDYYQVLYPEVSS
jgi:sphingomyelin phosphodiesterase